MENMDCSGFSPTEMVAHCHRCVVLLSPSTKEEATGVRGPNANRDRSLHVVELLGRILFAAMVSGHVSNKVAQGSRSCSRCSVDGCSQISFPGDVLVSMSPESGLRFRFVLVLHG